MTPKFRFQFNPACWVVGIAVERNVPMSDKGFMRAFHATLVSVLFGPFALFIWLNAKEA